MSSLPTLSSTIRAVTRPIEPPADLLEHADPDGFAWIHGSGGFMTSGTAAVVEPDAVDAVLAGIEVDDPLRWPGTGPIAVGALGFDPARPAGLVIPNEVIGCTPDGRGWITQIGEPRHRHLRATSPPSRPPRRVRATTQPDHDTWRQWIETTLDEIRRGELEKVVLARELHVEADEPLSTGRLLHRLRTAQPGCFVHHAQGLIGASPELLIRRVGRQVASRPMAGTARVGTAAFDRLGTSPKNGLEHRFVVDHVAAVLRSLCESVEVPASPVTCTFSSVAHLTTPISGRVLETAPSALGLARLLHPTPAVAGTPVAAAMRAIARLEPRGRGRYAGPVGWVDRRGDGEWVLALRGAELEGSTGAVRRAGAGIVTGSDPDSEWTEIDAKLEPMLRAIGGDVVEPGPRR